MKIKITYQLYADGDYSLRNREEFGCTGFEVLVDEDEYFDYVGEMVFEHEDAHRCQREAKTFLEKFLCDGIHVSHSHYWIIDDFYHAIDALIDFINDNDSGCYTKKFCCDVLLIEFVFDGGDYMRAICCAILSFTSAYLAKNLAEKEETESAKGFFLLLSWILFSVSVILMVLGL